MNQSTSKPHSCRFWLNPVLQGGIIALIAFGVRAACILYYGPILTNDSGFYLEVAARLLRGEGWGELHRVPPLYPVFVAAALAVCKSHWSVLWAQTVVGTATCLILWATCRRIFRVSFAFWLGLAVSLYLPLAAFCTVMIRETLIACGVALTTWCLVRALGDPKGGWYWATGLAAVFTTFTQFTFQVFPFWMAVACWLATGSWRQTARALGPVLGCLVLATGLWTARNVALTSRWILFSPDHVGCYLLEGIMDSNRIPGEKRLTPSQIAHLGVAEDDPYNTYAGLRDRYITGDVETKLRDGPELFRRAVRLIRHEPVKYLRFSLQRLHRLWFKDLWVERTEPSYLNLRPLDRLRASGNPLALVATLLIYGFGYSGLPGMLVMGRRGLGLLVPVATLLSFHIWVHAETRYALPIHPHLLVFSVVAVAWLWLRLAKRRSAAEASAALFLARLGTA